VNAKDGEGRTALYRASQSRNKEVESLLKSHGCSLDSSPNHPYGQHPINVLENHSFHEEEEAFERYQPNRPSSASSKSSATSILRRSLKHVLSPRSEDLSRIPSSDI
jgi:ankyrin repeat protein